MKYSYLNNIAYCKYRQYLQRSCLKINLLLIMYGNTHKPKQTQLKKMALKFF